MFKSDNNTNNANNILDDTRYNNTNNIHFITIYVDDLSLFGLKGPVIDNLRHLLNSEFKVTDLDNLHWLLERIEYREHDIILSQSIYIDIIFKRFGLYDCNPVTYLLDKNH